LRYRQKSTGQVCRWLAVAIDQTAGRDDALMAVYCPDDNSHLIHVLVKSEFDEQFALLDE
jgi:hypothetical protein